MCVFALYCVHQEVADHDGKVLLNIYPFKKKNKKTYSLVIGVIRERSVNLSAQQKLQVKEGDF